MYPGLSDADCQVAAFHYRQLVDEGQRQQVFTGLRSASGVTRLASGSVRRQVGALLVRSGRRLQGVQMTAGESLVPTSSGEIGAVA
jgi:hypothetical protein